jgi:hypothetical protein
MLELQFASLRTIVGGLPICMADPSPQWLPRVYNGFTSWSANGDVRILGIGLDHYAVYTWQNGLDWFKEDFRAPTISIHGGSVPVAFSVDSIAYVAVPFEYE